SVIVSTIHLRTGGLLLSLLCFTYLSFSQTNPMRFDHISVEQGLSNFTPFNIIQDKFGFLWIGTEDGLNRYDGHTFTVYKHRPQDSTSISSNTVTGTAVDRRGTLWLTASSHMLMRYNPNSDSFVRYSLKDSLVPKDFFMVSGAIVPDETDDGIWIATNHGLRLFHPPTGELLAFRLAVPDSQAFWSNVMTCLIDDRSGNLWIGSNNGIHRFNKQTATFKSYFPQSRYPSSPHSRNTINSIVIDSTGTIWAGAAAGLMQYNPTTDEFQPVKLRVEGQQYAPGDLFIVPMFVDAGGVLWFGTFNEGLIKYDANQGKFVQFLSNPKNPRSLLNNRVTCIYQDRSGVLWVGNYRAGLNKYNRREDQFAHYPTAEAVYAIWEDSFGDLWVGTSGEGLFRYKGGRGIPEQFFSGGNPPRLPRTNSVYSLCEESNGDMWIGTNIGLSRYDRATGIFRNYRVAPPSQRAEEHNIKSLMIDRDGDLWAGSVTHGMFRFNRQTETFTAYVHHPDDSTSLANNGVWSLFQDSKGRIWVATFGGGLTLFDKASNRFTRRYMTKAEDTTTLGGDALYTVREDNTGNLWVGQFATGATKLDPETGLCVQYNDLNGLSDNFVKTILFDSKGNPWMGTDKGITFLDVASGQFEYYKEKDGLHSNVLLSGAAFKNRDGRFYFGGINGVTAFYPDSLKRSSYKPPVVVTSFHVFGKPHPLEHSIMQTPRIKLEHDQNSLSFEFVSLDFSLPEKNQFAYRLDGIDPEWMYVGTRRFAGYSHLPPGEYTFRVIGTNSDGIWNFEGASTHIIITPPFWGTWWFRAGAVLALFGIGVAAYNYRVNRLLEIERLRVRIASDLHDDIGSSLTKISLQSELIQEGFEPEERENYLQNIASMSRELVTSMSDIVWSIDARNDTIENLLDKMRSFGLSTLSAKDIGFSISHSGFEVKKKLSVDVRENIYLIFKEAINNVAKHANANSVNVVLRNDSDKCSMLIVDNGKGWEGVERPSGHGTKNMKMRAERLGGTIEFVKDEGTRVMLTMRRL
ncbi:MAG: hypothetical protein KF749_00920, partial [Bacteroidetes bacterium]|nr:hypothetical protein [Bacteroidota bacterium]